MTGVTTLLTVEDGWRTLADGMNIHRWFLAGDRILRHRLEHRYKMAASPALRPLTELRRGWSRACLLQLLHPEQDPAVAGAVLSAEPPAVADRLALAPAVHRASTGELLAPAADLGSALLPPPAVVEQALVLVGRAGLGPLCTVTVELLVPAPPGSELRTDARQLGGCIPVRLSAGPVAVAVDLAVGAAMQMLAGLNERYGTPEHARARTRSPRSGAEQPALESAAEALAIGITERVLAACVRARLPGTDEAGRMLAQVRNEVARVTPAAYELADVLELTCFEYLVSCLPGDRQYEKYRRGSGMGQ